MPCSASFRPPRRLKIQALVLLSSLALIPLARAQGSELGETAEALPGTTGLNAVDPNSCGETPACPEPMPCPETPACQACPRCPRCAEPTPPLDAAQLSTIYFLTGTMASVVAVPSALAVGTALGAAPSNLFAAAIPALLVTAVLPPVAVAGGEWLLGSWLVDDPGSLGWTLGSTALVHVGALVAAGLLQVSTHDLAAVATLTAAEALLLPVVATTTLILTRSSEEE